MESVNCCICGEEYKKSEDNIVCINKENYDVCNECLNLIDKKQLKILLASFSLRNKRMQNRLNKLDKLLE